jgi:hypothetical protein
MSLSSGIRCSWPLLLAGLLIVLMMCFPPFRRAGDWHAVATGEPINSEFAVKFDRWYFGYLPQFEWIGFCDTEEELSPGCIVTLENQGPNRCARVRWVVDWWVLAAEFALMGVLVLAFLGPRIGVRRLFVLE